MLPSLPSFVEQIANCASQKLRRVGWEVVRPELQDPTRNGKWPEDLEVCPPPPPPPYQYPIPSELLKLAGRCPACVSR